VPQGSQQQLQLQIADLSQQLSDLQFDKQLLQAELRRKAASGTRASTAETGKPAAAHTVARLASGSSNQQQKLKAVKLKAALNSSIGSPSTPDAVSRQETRCLASNSGLKPFDSNTAVSEAGSSRETEPATTAGNAATQITEQHRQQHHQQPSSGGPMPHADSATAQGPHPLPPGTTVAKEPSTGLANKASCVSYAPQQWEENKQLLTRIEVLR
jgi:hypothetical protein